MSPAAPTATLNSGYSIPLVGLGCWMSKPLSAEHVAEHEETYQMVKSAIKAGYRHFDTAGGYGNEEAVGRAIRESAIPRDELFVTTKLSPIDARDPKTAFERSLKLLDLDYIDLYLVHWPQVANADKKGSVDPEGKPGVSETWAEMEKLLDTGKVRSIGVSNFAPKFLNKLFATAKVTPAVHQIEVHPYLPEGPAPGTLELCKEKGIHITAYSPLGQYNSPILKDTVIKGIADKHGKTTGQVVLSWAVQHGISVVPKSATPSRQAANLDVFTLGEDEMSAIDALHKQEGKHMALCSGPPGYFGWSFEQLGWDEKYFAHRN